MKEYSRFFAYVALFIIACLVLRPAFQCIETQRQIALKKLEETEQRTGTRCYIEENDFVEIKRPIESKPQSETDDSDETMKQAIEVIEFYRGFLG